ANVLRLIHSGPTRAVGPSIGSRPDGGRLLVLGGPDRLGGAATHSWKSGRHTLRNPHSRATPKTARCSERIGGCVVRPCPSVPQDVPQIVVAEAPVRVQA